MSRGRTADAASAALAAAVIAASLTLGRVFTDWSFLPAVVAAATVPILLDVLGRHRGWSLARTLTVTVVAVALLGAWVIAGSTTFLGVPLPETVRTLVDRAGDGWTVFRTGRPPVPVTGGVLLLCMLLAATAATVATTMATRADATIGALVPPLLLFVVGTTLGTERSRIVLTAVFAAAALTFLALAHSALLESRRTWFTGRRPSRGALAGLGALIGTAAVLTGLVVAPALPGATSGPLLDYRRFGGTSDAPGPYRTLSPLVDIRRRLTDQPDTELFTVRSPLRLYWRVIALDRFDGQVWTMRGETVDAPAPDRAPRGALGQEFAIATLGQRWLPAASTAVATDVRGARVVPASGTLVAPKVVDGIRYRVWSQLPPTVDAAAAAATARPVPPAYRSSLELPVDFPRPVAALARAITADAPNPYVAAKQLEEYFTGGRFTYDLDVPAGSGTDAIVDFLTVRRGFCEQFAGTYAAMARAAGLPARVVVGFTPGAVAEGDDRLTVTARDAHAWAEVWLAGLGWTAFEPTPAGGAPGQADAAVGEPTPIGATTTTTAGSTTPTTAPPRRDTAAAPNRGRQDIRVDGGGASGGGTDRISWAPMALVLALVVGLGLVVARVPLRRMRRRRTRRHAADPVVSVEGAWHDALEQLARSGVPVRAACTPTEQVALARQAGIRAEAIDALDRLAARLELAVWSPDPVDPADVVDAWHDADVLRHALRTEAEGTERVRRVWRDAPVEVG